VDSLPLALQAKLLRAVEERVFEPVGSNRTQPMKARLIAACNRPLEQEVAQGRFRSDLFYRLNVVGFELPPLRERQESIPELTRTILASFAEEQGRAVPTIDAEAMAALKAHDWPGNIRELRNVVERALVLCEGDRIQLDDLPECFLELAPGTEVEVPVVAAAAAIDDGATLVASREHAERHRIVKALHKHGNNRLRAAAELGISRMTLYNKLHKLGMI
jgi:two-component system NtrC family response regulator